jgi:hypothetical protein
MTHASDILNDILGDDGLGDPDDEPHQIRLPFLLPGTVMDRKDPLGVGRIRAFVDALFEDGTPWLTPMTPNGGMAHRGLFDPPRRGATVCVFFPLGKVGPGFYIPGGWYQPSDLPYGAKVEGDRTNSVHEDDHWLITRSDIDGEGVYEILHKEQGTFIRLNESGDVVIKAKSGKLGDEAVSAMAMGTELKAYLDALTIKLNTHIHAGGTLAGFTGVTSGSLIPPSNFFSPPSGEVLSDKWKVEK